MFEPGKQLDEMAHQVIGAAIEVHRHLGPGYLECVYEAPIHKAQMISYLKANDLRLGLLINFQVAILKRGIQRVVLTKYL